MNQYITGALIKELREKKNLTQAMLAEKLNVSDKTISKWETCKGYPDITLLEKIADVFDISVAELFSGNVIKNMNVSSNMLRSNIYVCPVCGNVIHSMGELSLSCHGVNLLPQNAEACDDEHPVIIEKIEDDYFIRIDHEMTKSHYISFISAVSSDRVQTVKLYPEGNAECRIPIRGVLRIFFYCNKDGLYYYNIHKKPYNK